MEFKEQFIFEEEKDTPVESASKFKKKITKKYGREINVRDIYIKVINYQVKTYGTTLDDSLTYYTKEEHRKISQNNWKERHSK